MDIVLKIKQKYDDADYNKVNIIGEKRLRNDFDDNYQRHERNKTVAEKRNRNDFQNKQINNDFSLLDKCSSMDKRSFECNQHGYDYFKYAIELDIFLVEQVFRKRPNMFQLYFRNKNIEDVFTNIRSDIQKLKTKISFVCKCAHCKHRETCVNLHESTLRNLYEIYYAIQTSYNDFLEYNSLKTSSHLARDISRFEAELFFVVSRHHVGYCLFFNVDMNT